jgi:hypothetical protein
MCRHPVGTPARRIVADEIRSGSLAALAPFIAGALGGFVLLFVDLPFEKLLGGDAWSKAGREFLRRPETLVWLTLLTAQAGLWLVGASPPGACSRQSAAGGRAPWRSPASR